MARSMRVGAVLMLAVVVAVAGCAKKKRLADESTPIGGGPSGGAVAEGSSLDRYKRGLGPEEGGVLKDVHFMYDSYELDREARDVLAANAEWLKENPRARTEIEGHCDERGTIEYNLALGARRGKAVKDYLVTLGVAADRLSTISYGEELPLCRDATEACYARNRRVHFVPPSQ
jgi:peptidoglycan-associated lipoprotein